MQIDAYHVCFLKRPLPLSASNPAVLTLSLHFVCESRSTGTRNVSFGKYIDMRRFVRNETAHFSD